MDKKELHKKCIELVQSRIRELDDEIASLQESKFKETKSTAGDKYETGRAMLQAEEDRLTERRAVAQNMLHTLNNLDASTPKEKVDLGSLVIANDTNYFISSALGKIMLEDTSVYCISAISPIGKVLVGKELNEEISFNGQIMRIEKIL